MAFYAKYYQANFTYKALHDPWSHFIFGLWWVSRAEYLLILRFYFPLLQIIRCIMVTVRIASVLPWTRSRALGKAFLVNRSIMLLGNCDHELAPYLNNDGDVGFKLYLLLLLFYLNLVCNNFNQLWCIELYLWTLCNVWHVCWIMYDLGCMLVEETLHGTRRTTKFIWAQVW